MIYLDNAATTLKKPDAVIEAVTNALQHLGNAGRGATDEAMETSRLVFRCRQNICDLINGTSPSQVAFTSNATEALNIAIKGLFKKGDHVITTEMEHNSVLRPLFELRDRGIEVTYVKVNENGFVDAESIATQVRENTKAIVITYASNLTGNTNPINDISKVAKEHQLHLIVDGAQILGEQVIDVQASNIDVLCFTGHKGLMGPQGTGGLYVSERLTIEPLKTGGSGTQTFDEQHPREMPTALEAGTLNGHGIAGLNAAIEYLLDYGVDNIADELSELTFYFYDHVRKIPDVKVYGYFNPQVPRAPIVALNMGDTDSSEIANRLNEDYGIAVRSGGHCAPMMHHALGTNTQGAVRFSFSHFTTKEELDQAIEALKHIQKTMFN